MENRENRREPVEKKRKKHNKIEIENRENRREPVEKKEKSITK